MITIYNYYTTYYLAPLRHLKFKLIVIPQLWKYIYIMLLLFSNLKLLWPTGPSLWHMLCQSRSVIYISGYNSWFIIIKLEEE